MFHYKTGHLVMCFVKIIRVRNHMVTILLFYINYFHAFRIRNNPKGDSNQPVPPFCGANELSPKIMTELVTSAYQVNPLLVGV